MNSTLGKKNRHSCFFGLVLDQKYFLVLKQAVNCISQFFYMLHSKDFHFQGEMVEHFCDSSSHEIAIPWDYVWNMFRGVEQKIQVQ